MRCISFLYDHLKTINIYVGIEAVRNASNEFILKFRYYHNNETN